MWKKSNSFLKKISVLFVLFLVLGLSPLAALPGWLTGSADGERIFLLQNTIAEKEVLIESLNLYIAELEIQLNELLETSKKWTTINSELENFITDLRLQLRNLQVSLKAREEEMLNLRNAYSELQTQLEDLVTASTDSEGSDQTLSTLVKQLQTQLATSSANLDLAILETESLKQNLSQLETLTGLSKESFEALMDDYLPLKDAYDLKSAESDKYYQEAVNAKADKFNGLVGIDGIKYPSGNWGMGVSLGLGFGNYMLMLGAEYELVSPVVFDATQITYRAGLAIRF